MSGVAISLRDKIAIVTGGTSGIGKGIAQALGRAGARVVINGLDETRGRRAEQELRSLGVDTHFFAADISDDAAIERMLKQTVAWYGRLDILVNNAAHVHHGMYQTLAQLPQAEWDKALAINYRAAVVCCKTALPELEKSRGCILNISSVGAVETFSNATAYCPAKAALEHFTRGLARELATLSIRVNAIAPGWIDTPGVAFHTSDAEKTRAIVAQKIPLGRLGKPEDIGNCAVFVVSDLAAYMTGSVVTVDGGWLLV
jgi:NAD(P)-dependent dehydrogenase (short-subunit alcohol dehydrogenase family)